LFEQDTVRLVLRKNGRHPVLMIEPDLDRSPAVVNLIIPKFAPNQMRRMKGKNAQEQMCLNPYFLPMADGMQTGSEFIAQ